MSKNTEFADILTQDDAVTRPVSLLEAARNEKAVMADTRLRYRAGFPRFEAPDPPEDGESIEFAEVFPGVDPPYERRFVKPAVWEKPSPSKEAFLALQRWEGVVTECRNDTFIARLTDLTAEGPAEEVELSISDVSPEDLSLVELGAVFYWSIGYRDDASGSRLRASTLRFRRLPVWSEQELDAATERAAEIAKVFDGD
jgi:hypothetical protein